MSNLNPYVPPKWAKYNRNNEYAEVLINHEQPTGFGRMQFRHFGTPFHTIRHNNTSGGMQVVDANGVQHIFVNHATGECDINDVSILGNVISTSVTNGDLIVQGNGTGRVIMDDTAQLITTVTAATSAELTTRLAALTGSMNPIVISLTGTTYDLTPFSTARTFRSLTLRASGQATRHGSWMINRPGNLITSAGNQITLPGAGFLSIAINDVLIFADATAMTTTEFTVTAVTSNNVFDVNPAPPAAFVNGDAFGVKAPVTISGAGTISIQNLVAADCKASLNFEGIHFDQAIIAMNSTTRLDTTFSFINCSARLCTTSNSFNLAQMSDISMRTCFWAEPGGATSLCRLRAQGVFFGSSFDGVAGDWDFQNGATAFLNSCGGTGSNAAVSAAFANSVFMRNTNFFSQAATANNLISFTNVPSVVVDLCRFSKENFGAHAAAVILCDGANATLSNSTFVSSAAITTGVLRALRGSVVATNTCTFENAAYSIEAQTGSIVSTTGNTYTAPVTNNFLAGATAGAAVPTLDAAGGATGVY